MWTASTSGKKPALDFLQCHPGVTPIKKGLPGKPGKPLIYLEPMM